MESHSPCSIAATEFADEVNQLPQLPASKKLLETVYRRVQVDSFG